MYRALDRWLIGYLKSVLRRPRRWRAPLELCLCVADHYEPLSPGGRQPHEVGLRRVARWQREYPALARQFADADGRPPRHSFFYPVEEYHRDFLAPLQELTAAGLGEVEIHLHHDGDTSATLAATLAGFRDLLRREHGLLGSDAEGRPRYAFVHGNWALCNSRPDGRHCGVNEELAVLRETGCYVDLTMPSGASPTQTPLVNLPYYASDLPGRPAGHCRGVPLAVVPGATPAAGPLPARGDLLLLPGPLALNWGWRKWGLLPRLEYGDLCGSNPPTAQRLGLWLRQQIHVAGQPQWVLVKLHTHGCTEANTDVLLGAPMANLHRLLAEARHAGQPCRLHYVTARELYNLAKAAEAGATGDPGAWRDFVISPPPAARPR